jgi:hypothetical protein
MNTPRPPGPHTPSPRRRTVRDLYVSTPKRKYSADPYKVSPLAKLLRAEEDSEIHEKSLQDTVSSFQRAAAFSCADLNTQSDETIFLALCAQLGFQTVLNLAATVSHIPEVFPNRNKYIGNLLNLDRTLKLSDIEISKFVKNIASCSYFGDSSIKVDITHLLWRASEHYKEPYTAFIVPHVNTCLNGECSGILYPAHTSSVTLFTLNGPLPAQKCVLRCRMCNTYYNVDGFTVPKRGKQLYPDQFAPKWKTASNRRYFSIDLHEFLCESG